MNTLTKLSLLGCVSLGLIPITTIAAKNVERQVALVSFNQAQLARGFTIVSRRHYNRRYRPRRLYSRRYRSRRLYSRRYYRRSRFSVGFGYNYSPRFRRAYYGYRYWQFYPFYRRNYYSPNYYGYYPYYGYYTYYYPYRYWYYRRNNSYRYNNSRRYNYRKRCSRRCFWSKRYKKRICRFRC